MNQLERAATTLLDRPVAPAAPLDVIERRARALRRRRRLLEAGVLAVLVLVLGTAGLVLNAARDSDSEQGVYVGEGPSVPGAFPPPAASGATVLVFTSSAPLEDAVRSEAEDALRARLVAVGLDPEAPTWERTAPTGTAIGYRVPDSSHGDLTDTLTTIGIQGQMLLPGPTPLLVGPADIRSAEIDAQAPTDVRVVLEDSAVTRVQAGVYQCPGYSKCISQDVSFPVTGPAQAKLVDVTTGGVTIRFADADHARLHAAVLANRLPDGVTLVGAIVTGSTSPTGAEPSGEAGTSTIYHLQAEPDVSTAEALIQVLQARFRTFGMGDATVQVDGTEVRVTTATPADRTALLVTAEGGIDLRRIDREVDPSVCDAQADAGRPNALFGSSLAGPPTCYEFGTGYALGSTETPEANVALADDGRYRVGVILSLEESAGVVSVFPCTTSGALGCSIGPLALVSGRSLVHPSVSVSVNDGTELSVFISVPGFDDPDDADVVAVTLSHPLPDGVSFLP